MRKAFPCHGVIRQWHVFIGWRIPYNYYVGGKLSNVEDSLIEYLFNDCIDCASIQNCISWNTTITIGICRNRNVFLGHVSCQIPHFPQQGIDFIRYYITFHHSLGWSHKRVKATQAIIWTHVEYCSTHLIIFYEQWLRYQFMKWTKFQHCSRKLRSRFQDQWIKYVPTNTGYHYV